MRGQIVGAFLLAVPGVVGAADDTARRTRSLEASLAEAAHRVRALGEPLSEWTATLARYMTEALEERSRLDAGKKRAWSKLLP